MAHLARWATQQRSNKLQRTNQIVFDKECLFKLLDFPKKSWSTDEYNVFKWIEADDVFGRFGVEIIENVNTITNPTTRINEIEFIVNKFIKIQAIVKGFSEGFHVAGYLKIHTSVEGRVIFKGNASAKTIEELQEQLGNIKLIFDGISRGIGGGSVSKNIIGANNGSLELLFEFSKSIPGFVTALMLIITWALNARKLYFESERHKVELEKLNMRSSDKMIELLNNDFKHKLQLLRQDLSDDIKNIRTSNNKENDHEDNNAFKEAMTRLNNFIANGGKIIAISSDDQHQDDEMNLLERYDEIQRLEGELKQLEGPSRLLESNLDEIE